MTLKSRIQQDITEHMKAGRTFERDTLRLVLGEIQTAEKAEKTPKNFSDVQVEAFLTKQVKTRRETAAVYEKAGEQARAEKENKEADLIASYIPQPLSRAEVEVIVNTAFTLFENPTQKQMGEIMKAVGAVVKGRYSGKEISDMVKARLS